VARLPSPPPHSATSNAVPKLASPSSILTCVRSVATVPGSFLGKVVAAAGRKRSSSVESLGAVNFRRVSGFPPPVHYRTWSSSRFPPFFFCAAYTDAMCSWGGTISRSIPGSHTSPMTRLSAMAASRSIWVLLAKLALPSRRETSCPLADWRTNPDASSFAWLRRGALLPELPPGLAWPPSPASAGVSLLPVNCQPLRSVAFPIYAAPDGGASLCPPGGDERRPADVKIHLTSTPTRSRPGRPRRIPSPTLRRGWVASVARVQADRAGQRGFDLVELATAGIFVRITTSYGTPSKQSTLCVHGCTC
jgi:hypothetical protein